jgi:predicted deacylase
MSAASTLSVVWEEFSLNLPLYSFGEGTPGILIVAGVHGREHSGIQISYALADRLTEIPEVQGTIEILPVANPESFAAETRENPVDGKNLGERFSPSDPSRQDETQTEAIAATILSRLDAVSHLLDLHSAGEGRYLAHALFLQEQDAPTAAASGLPFALLRRRTREGREAGMLSYAAFQRGIPALALELGGGITTYPEDIDQGIRSVISLLAFWGHLPQKYRLNPTSPDRVHLRDDRKFIRAWEEGAFYPMCALGEILEKGQRIGTWISLEHLRAVPVVALGSGVLIYIRTRCRSHSGDTLAMLLPEVTVQGMKKE